MHDIFTNYYKTDKFIEDPVNIIAICYRYAHVSHEELYTASRKTSDLLNKFYLTDTFW